MQVTTIISDIAGVLLRRDPTWNEDTKWEAQLGLKKGVLFQALFHPEWDEAALLGHLADQEVFQQASAILGLERDQLTGFEQVFWSQYQLNEELATFLTSLRPHVRVALLSNAWPGARSAFNRLFCLDTLVDLQIYSAEEGLVKPDERLYFLTLERLAIQPGEAFFLDDRWENIQAAQQLGLRTFLFQENSQAIAAIQQAVHV